MLARSSRPRSFFKKLIVNGVSNSKTAIRNDCLIRLYDADAELKAISSELDSFDGKKDPVRCNLLVNQLRTAQDKVISLLFQLMDDCNCERASRDYRMKFPDEILLSEGSESLNGQIWFGAECLSAGSNILNHTKESTMLRPMAKTLTTHLDSLRNDLRDLIIDGGGASRINSALIKKMVAFDQIFATFEYEYVRTMLPIRTVVEIERLQEVAVLFSETLIDCLKRGLIKQDDIDEFQPIVMIAIPRLAIVRGLLYKNSNPIYTRHKSQMCSLFQPFHGPLHSIRKLLRGLNPKELLYLEKMLANDQSTNDSRPESPSSSKNSAENLDDSCAVKSSDNINKVNKSIANDEETNGENAFESEAGTSRNYSNVLMDGLSYPVGQKINRDPSPDNFAQSEKVDVMQHEDEYDPSSQISASSSKSIQINEDRPSHPSCSPTSTSSSDKMAQELGNEAEDCSRLQQDDDGQFEKLIAEFRPSSSGQSDQAKLEVLLEKQAQQLLHRLFVAISGVADQLQSNFASDLRFILRHIFSSEIEGSEDYEVDDEEEEEHADDDEENSHSDNLNEDQSDGSLPIEQGIEAHEVANLIDLNSGVNLDSVSLQAASIFMNQYTETQAIGPTPTVYNLTNDQSELIFESRSSPNERSIMDSPTYRQQIHGQMRQQNHDHQPQQSVTRCPDIHGQQTNNQGDSGNYNVMRHNLSRQLNENRVGHSSRSESGERRHRHRGTRSSRARGPPVWVPDQLVVACSSCSVAFTLFRRRHHCRACGQIFCADCSKFTKYLNCWGYNGPVRVCESCYMQP